MSFPEVRSSVTLSSFTAGSKSFARTSTLPVALTKNVTSIMELDEMDTTDESLPVVPGIAATPPKAAANVPPARQGKETKKTKNSKLAGKELQRS